MPLLHVVLPLLIAFALPFVTIGIAKAGVFSAEDNKETRNWHAKLTGWRQRAYWSHVNALETVPMFAAAVIVGHLGAPGNATCAIAAYAYCALRIAYLGAFLANWGAVRSLIWFGSMAALATPMLVALTA